MPDNILLAVFGSLSAVSLLFSAFSMYRAYKHALSFKHEIRMVLWGTASIAGLVFGLACWVFFLIPILRNHL